jgi:hypothetical protein
VHRWLNCSCRLAFRCKATTEYGVRFTYTGTVGYLSTWWTPDAGTTNAHASHAGETTPIFLSSAAPIETNITLPLSASVSGTLPTSSGGVPDTPTNIYFKRYADDPGAVQ